MSNHLQELQQRHQEFIADRDWEQFHTPKSIAMAISVEANELVEQFQWHDNLPAEAYEDSEIKSAVAEELADVIIYCLSMAATLDIDIEAAISEKLEANEQRFDHERSEEIKEDLERWKDSGDSEESK